MGLAAPRKRFKLSHDPNNTAWTSTATSTTNTSFGSRLMQSSGWVPGTALGANSMPVSESSAAKVKIAVKDDMLGLGASLKSRSVEHQRTGLDAFQGLLGRLNAKTDDEVKREEEKVENKKLAMFAMGRWGGMVFVPGGLLVQEDPTEVVEVVVETKNEDTPIDKAEDEEAESKAKSKRSENETPEERAQRKAEKRKRREEKQTRKEAKRLKRSLKESGIAVSASATPDLTETSTGTSTPISAAGNSGTSTPRQVIPNGRALLRSRNYQAKRMAFSDAKGLDQIFMKTAQQV